jgi:hypothetical protein
MEMSVNGLSTSCGIASWSDLSGKWLHAVEDAVSATFVGE